MRTTTHALTAAAVTRPLTSPARSPCRAASTTTSTSAGFGRTSRKPGSRGHSSTLTTTSSSRPPPSSSRYGWARRRAASTRRLPRSGVAQGGGQVGRHVVGHLLGDTREPVLAEPRGAEAGVTGRPHHLAGRDVDQARGHADRRRLGETRLVAVLGHRALQDVAHLEEAADPLRGGQAARVGRIEVVAPRQIGDLARVHDRHGPSGQDLGNEEITRDLARAQRRGLVLEREHRDPRDPGRAGLDPVLVGARASEQREYADRQHDRPPAPPHRSLSTGCRGARGTILPGPRRWWIRCFEYRARALP